MDSGEKGELCVGFYGFRLHILLSPSFCVSLSEKKSEDEPQPARANETDRHSENKCEALQKLIHIQLKAEAVLIFRNAFSQKWSQDGTNCHTYFSGCVDNDRFHKYFEISGGTRQMTQKLSDEICSHSSAERLMFYYAIAQPKNTTTWHWNRQHIEYTECCTDCMGRRKFQRAHSSQCLNRSGLCLPFYLFLIEKLPGEEIWHTIVGSQLVNAISNQFACE